MTAAILLISELNFLDRFALMLPGRSRTGESNKRPKVIASHTDEEDGDEDDVASPPQKDEETTKAQESERPLPATGH